MIELLITFFQKRTASVFGGCLDDAPTSEKRPRPFYVVDECCTACGVPSAEAPGLFAYDATDHCFVKRQPSTKAELNGMMRAVRGAELQCIRYRGKDPDILRRIGELGEPHLCDVPPSASIRPVFRNHVTFDAATSLGVALTPRDLAIAFQRYLRLQEGNKPSYEFTQIVAQKETAAFSFSWSQSNFNPIEFCAVLLPDCRWLVRHSPTEKLGSRAFSSAVDDWLKSNAQFCKIRWYTQEHWNGSKDWQETPW